MGTGVPISEGDCILRKAGPKSNLRPLCPVHPTLARTQGLPLQETAACSLETLQGRGGPHRLPWK